jgi:hypothetical protein
VNIAYKYLISMERYLAIGESDKSQINRFVRN